MKSPCWTESFIYALRRIERWTTEEKYSVRESVEMKRIRPLRTIVLILLAAFCVATARAQDARLQIDQLNRLAEKAAEVVEVTLDERSLRLAAQVSFPQ